ncbi:MAG: hypothetical protein HZA90_22140 [Verrucomicrobia bacterium]|nr:hypothetical protein [Verrucomicrobiota bacterium]
MESLKKLVALLQEHYEKALLGLALLALALAGVLLAYYKQSEEEELRQYTTGVASRKGKPYPPVDWASYRSSLQQGTNPANVVFAPPHNLFNPVKWLRRPDGSLLKVEQGNEVGAEALVVAKITPLHQTISLDVISSPTSFQMKVAWEEHPRTRRSAAPSGYVTTNNTHGLTNVFALKEIKGDPKDPELGIELTETSERVTLSKSRPYRRVVAYKADFSYPPEKKLIPNRYVNDFIIVGDETNSVVALTKDEVVLSNQSNNKRTILKYNAAP